MIRILNNLTGKYEFYEEPKAEPMPPPTPAELEAQYKQRTKDLIHEQYDTDREAQMQNIALAAILAGLPAPEEYLTMLQYIDACKDNAHLEVYGIERG